MDLGICAFDFNEKKLEYSGANIPLYLIRNNQLTEIKPSRQPIGIYPIEKKFVLHEINIFDDDIFYMSSDGYKDQIGGKEKSKFLSSRFKKLILDIHKKNLDDQKQILDNTFKKWIEDHNENNLLPDIDFKQFFSNLNNEQIEKRKQEMEKRIIEIRERITKSKAMAQINSEIIDHTKELSNQIQQLDDVLVIGLKI